MQLWRVLLPMSRQPQHQSKQPYTTPHKPLPPPLPLLQDGVILQLEGSKDWDVCGFAPPFDGEVLDMGTPHIEGSPDAGTELPKRLQRVVDGCKRIRLKKGDVL